MVLVATAKSSDYPHADAEHFPHDVILRAYRVRCQSGLRAHNGPAAWDGPWRLSSIEKTKLCSENRP